MSSSSSDSVVPTNFVSTGYGKNLVKILIVQRHGNFHQIREYEVNTELTLNSYKDYLFGDNSDIIATDSQKNTVYLLARKNGISTIEEFAISLCDHFLRQYPQVISSKIYIQQTPWKRIGMKGQPHNHAFQVVSEAVRFCEVVQKKHEGPTVTAGMKDFRILKTTQSGFANFVQDEYRTLADVTDRLFCTVVRSQWQYSTLAGINFDRAWDSVMESILELFAGSPETGLYSASVQQTLYLAEKMALSKVPQIGQIEIVMPNIHYFPFDFSKFPREFLTVTSEVYVPQEKPSGNIRACIKRVASKL